MIESVQMLIRTSSSHCCTLAMKAQTSTQANNMLAAVGTAAQQALSSLLQANRALLDLQHVEW
jgi:hypothetical protein